MSRHVLFSYVPKLVETVSLDFHITVFFCALLCIFYIQPMAAIQNKPTIYLSIYLVRL